MRLPERIITLTTAAAVVVVAAASVFASDGDPTAPTASSSAHGGSSGEPVIHVPVVRGGTLVGPRTGTPPLTAAALARLDIPPTAMLAYQRAVRVMDQADPSCRLSWTLLAAIGRVESDHGRYDGAQLEPDGVSSPVIRGVALDGRGPVARVRDTDGGRLDGDPVWDHAVGPMQLLPATWAVVAVDGDGDGIRSPDDLDDASLAAAVFLCAGPGDLRTPQGMRAAVHRYNPSTRYVASVLAAERAYRTGDFTLLGQPAQVGPVEVIVNPPTDGAPGSPSARPPAPPPASASGRLARADGPPGQASGGPDRQHRGKAAHRGSARHAGVPASTTSTPVAKSSGPSPTTPTDPPTDPPASSPADPPSTSGDPTVPGDPDPSDPGSPDPGSPGTGDPSPTTVDLTGVLDHCGPGAAGLCLDGATLDVGDAAYLAAPASADLDGDGTVESNGEELEGLVGTEVTVQAVAASVPALVLTVNGAAYRPAP